MAVGAARDGRPIYLGGFGDRDCEAGLPATVNTVMGIGSGTKTFTAVAIMQLQEAGKLSVNDPVTKYLPEFTTNQPELAWWEGGPMTAAGFLRSTVQDMLRFSEIFRTGGTAGATRLLTEASVTAMTTPHIEAETGIYYGYGLFVLPDYHGVEVVRHGGANKGVQAIFAIVPE